MLDGLSHTQLIVLACLLVMPILLVLLPIIDAALHWIERDDDPRPENRRR